MEVPDIKKFEDLFVGNHQFLCMIAYKVVEDHYVAEDIVQEFFLKYWEGRERIHITTSFESFAYRSVRNSSIDYLRKQSVADKHLHSISITELSYETEELDFAENDRRLKYVLQLLDELPTERRKVFELHALENLSYKQIADKLNISLNTVKTQLKRSYSKFRNATFALILFMYMFF